MEMVGHAGIVCKIMDKGEIYADSKKCPNTGAFFLYTKINHFMEGNL